MVRYIKCPRCELNYIDAEQQEYCDVCMKEMRGIKTDSDEIEEEEEDMSTELCPVCGENMMRPGEKMCDECRSKAEMEEEEPDPEEDTEWRSYLDDDTDVDLDAEIGEIDASLEGEFAEEDEEEEEDEEYHNDEEEDLEYVTGDEIYSLAGDDDDDDEGDDDDF